MLNIKNIKITRFTKLLNYKNITLFKIIRIINNIIYKLNFLKTIAKIFSMFYL